MIQLLVIILPPSTPGRYHDLNIRNNLASVTIRVLQRGHSLVLFMIRSEHARHIHRCLGHQISAIPHNGLNANDGISRTRSLQWRCWPLRLDISRITPYARGKTPCSVLCQVIPCLVESLLSSWKKVRATAKMNVLSFVGVCRQMCYPQLVLSLVLVVTPSHVVELLHAQRVPFVTPQELLATLALLRLRAWRELHVRHAHR